MQISHNTTEMQAGLCVATDKHARAHCVVVVKGTFAADARGELRLSEVQRPLVYADEHQGDAGSTSIRHECDFALTKPHSEVLVHGHAVAPKGRPIERMLVRLELPGRRKDLLVTGERRWERGLLGLSASPPRPFIRMPLVYERAFGGADHSHPDPKHQGADLRNPVGCGFRKNPRAADAVGAPLPNLEHPQQSLSKWDEAPVPVVGMGSLGRGWQPRIAHAGTYDQRWLDEDYPFLPRDFDTRYFQSAPEDQQLPRLRGGEVLRCMGMTAAGSWGVTLPRIALPVTFRFQDRSAHVEPQMDTVLLDCDAQVVTVTWRASTPLGKKLTQLKEVFVGSSPTRWGIRRVGAADAGKAPRGVRLAPRYRPFSWLPHRWDQWPASLGGGPRPAGARCPPPRVSRGERRLSRQCTRLGLAGSEWAFEAAWSLGWSDSGGSRCVRLRDAQTLGASPFRGAGRVGVRTGACDARFGRAPSRYWGSAGQPPGAERGGTRPERGRLSCRGRLG